MGPRVVVVGSGYAGTGLVQELDGDPRIDVTWISAADHHLVKHEVHRVIRSPSLGDGLTIPVSEIISDAIDFVHDRVIGVNGTDNTVDVASGETYPYDILALTAGARTAYYGIPGLKEHAHTLANVEDAQTIHRTLVDSSTEPFRVVVGGGGLTGIQVAGELYELANALDRSIDLTLVEALDDVLPHGPDSLRKRITDALKRRNICIETGSPIVETTADSVVLDGEQELPWDLLVWSGGITGTELDIQGDIELARNRVKADATLRTTDPHIFAFGDAAVIDQPDGIAPPTAQAAWQAAPLAATNIRATISGKPLHEWTFENKGTLISVGDAAFAHDVNGLPIDTFGSLPAATLKKAVAARWIADVDSWSRAMRLWKSL